MRCFEGFGSSRNSLQINLLPPVSLGAILATQLDMKTVYDVVESFELNYSHADSLQRII